MSDHRTIPNAFIPPREHKLYLLFFKWYVRWLFGRRFGRVWLHSAYSPSEGQSTLYFLNHHSWWDGITPLLLNDFVLHQHARAIMEDKQMRKYTFFSRIGAFSINRENARSALFSLDFASDWLNGRSNSLYVYPEGKITKTCDPLRFEAGILRIMMNAPEADTVPIALHISHREGDKPALFIRIGKPIAISDKTSKSEQITYLEQSLEALLRQTRDDAMLDVHGYTPLI